jgi:hypothetical protein
MLLTLLAQGQHPLLMLLEHLTIMVLLSLPDSLLLGELLSLFVVVKYLLILLETMLLGTQLLLLEPLKMLLQIVLLLFLLGFLTHNLALHAVALDTLDDFILDELQLFANELTSLHYLIIAFLFCLTV